MPIRGEFEENDTSSRRQSEFEENLRRMPIQGEFEEWWQTCYGCCKPWAGRYNFGEGGVVRKGGAPKNLLEDPRVDPSRENTMHIHMDKQYNHSLR